MRRGQSRANYPSGVITEFSLPICGDGRLPVSPTGITAGPDGNLRFTEGCGRIGRMSPSGAITEFPLPNDRVPTEITAGPDGNLWFTAPTEGFTSGSACYYINPCGKSWSIGRITPSGTVTEFVVPTLSYGFCCVIPSAGIMAGPDGNLWFTEPTANTIGRITPTGVMTEFSPDYPATTGNFPEPRAITSGPGGNLWKPPPRLVG